MKKLRKTRKLIEIQGIDEQTRHTIRVILRHETNRSVYSARWAAETENKTVIDSTRSEGLGDRFSFSEYVGYEFV